jgi:hypothetical protein
MKKFIDKYTFGLFVVLMIIIVIILNIMDM